MMLRFAVWLFLPALGCTAAKGTYHLAEAEQAFALARDVEASERAVYAWTLAEAYMLKAREEYENADYEAAERLSAQARRWADKARAITEGREREDLGDPDSLPEDYQRPREADPILRPQEVPHLPEGDE